MSEPKPLATLPPSLPQYPQPGPPRLNKDQQGPLMKMLGKMMAKRLPRLGKNPNIHSQSVKIGHKKKERGTMYW